MGKVGNGQDKGVGEEEAGEGDGREGRKVRRSGEERE